MATSKLKKVQKSNDLNQANFSDFSLSCYRVILNLITKIQRHDVNGNPLPINLVSRSCSLSVAEYAKEFGIEQDNAYAILKEATDKLMKTSFSIQNGKNILKINVCSQAEYRKSEGRIDIEFTPNIMPHLAELTGNFTMYNLNDIAGFSSIYTTRFFELVMQFKQTGELKISVADLRFKLGCIKKFKQYYDFKKFTFTHAMNEINQQWNFNIQLVDEIKTGRTVTDLVFTFRKTFTRKAFDPIRQKMRTECISKPQRKTNNDNDKTPPSPKQEVSKPKTVRGKVLKVLGAEPEHIEAAENGTSHIEASKKVITRRVKKVKAVVEKTADDVKAIIKALMEEDDITETQATIKAIKLKLI